MKLKYTVTLTALVALCGGWAACDDSASAGSGLTITYPALFDACVTLDACNDSGGEVYGICLIGTIATATDTRNDLRVVDGFLKCVGESSTCAEARACEGTECQFETYDDTCQGNNLTTCFFGHLVRSDCGRFGQQCLTDAYGDAYCADGTCTVEQEGSSCDGASIVDCWDGISTRTDCRREVVDGVCQEIDGVPICVSGPVTPCNEETFAARCDGDVAVTCDDGYVTRWDCGDYPYPSQCVSEEQWAWCTLQGTACGDIEEFECRCAGSVLQCCMFEALEEFDCADLGQSCQTVPDDYWAYCESAPS